MRYFAVICEARPDFETATDLADRVLVESIGWLEPDTLESVRTWRSGKNDGPFLTWTGVKHLARQEGIRAQGHFGEEPAAPDAKAARRALRLLRRLDFPVHGVLLIRDEDTDSRRREGLEQARREFSKDLPIVIGVARTKRECWVLAGFDPCDAQERERLDGLRRELGFSPVEQAEVLSAKHEEDRKSAKRVLRQLTGGDPDRERQCWSTTPLALLRGRGVASGLKDYLEEIEDRLVPVLVGPAPGAETGGSID